MFKYIFDATATAAYYDYTSARKPFGHEYSAAYRGSDPFHYEAETEGRKGEISFSSAFVSIECKQENGVYTTIAKSRLTDYNVKNIVTAGRLECGIQTVYREEWYGDPKKPKHARILPIRPVIENLEICGQPYEVELPKAFSLDADEREQYFLGEGATKQPKGISKAAGKSVRTRCGLIRISDDTRRIVIPKFGIVYFADWTWRSPSFYIPEKSYQRIQLVRLNLQNPGHTGGGGVGGNGTP